MARTRTLLLATLVTAIHAVSTVALQAADLNGEPRIASVALHRHRVTHWHLPVRGQLVAGVRGATPLTVPFYSSGWYPGPTYYYGWQRPVCCSGPRAVISVRY